MYVGYILGCPLFNATMPRWKFLEIMKYLRFDLKTKWRRNLEKDKFCLAILLWNPFIENCQKAYNSNVNIPIDEQLLPCRARCKFIQYMPKKLDKFRIKFCMAVDVESKYLYNGFPYLGKNLTRSGDASLPTDVVIKLISPLFGHCFNVPTDVVIKLISPLFGHGFNVTCDNYLTSLDLSLTLAKRQCSLMGSRRQRGRVVKAPD